VITGSLPGLDLFKTYQARWLAKDVVAGLVLLALLVPQGMAYAELAGLPASSRTDQRVPLTALQEGCGLRDHRARRLGSWSQPSHGRRPIISTG
jgi:hypothetical protein